MRPVIPQNAIHKFVPVLVPPAPHLDGYDGKSTGNTTKSHHAHAVECLRSFILAACF